MSRRRQAPPADFGTHRRIRDGLVDTTGSMSGHEKEPHTPERAIGYCFRTSAEDRERLRAEATAAG